jgi:hypothetical protein
MKTKLPVLALVSVLVLVAAQVASANSGVVLERWVLGGGATDSVSGGVGLRGTLGQPFVGVVSTGDIDLAQGFWATARGNIMYLPLVFRS